MVPRLVPEISSLDTFCDGAGGAGGAGAGIGDSRSWITLTPSQTQAWLPLMPSPTEMPFMFLLQ